MVGGGVYGFNHLVNPHASHGEYDLRPTRLNRLSGAPLRAAVRVMESPLGRLIAPVILRSVGLSRFREKKLEEPPTFLPLHVSDAAFADAGQLQAATVVSEPASSGPKFPFATVHDYQSAYAEGRVTPVEVAERILDAIRQGEEANPPLNAFIIVFRKELLEQARAALKRREAGTLLGPLDGIPIAIKDELDVASHRTMAGTSFSQIPPALEDSTVVARLRAAGALLVGKTAMHEIGIGVTGLSVRNGTPRNPFSPDHFPGGSSSGSAAAVAAGLCPVAIAADGGGSIRIPAAFCGLVGLKPTFGRVSEFGAFPLCWSVAHIGPIAATAADVRICYNVIAGADPKDPQTLRQPPLQGIGSTSDLSGLTLGIYPAWFEDAESEVVAQCRRLAHCFEQLGARVRKIRIPELEAARMAHAVTTASEMARAVEHFGRREHTSMGLDVRMNLAFARLYTAIDYLQAQRIRTRLIQTFRRIFEQVDAVLTPTAAIAAPEIKAGVRETGECDLETMTRIMRFVTPANLAGLPAISIPAGYTRSGLPIGLQAIAAPWREDTLLRLAASAEQFIERRAPEFFLQVLEKSTARPLAEVHSRGGLE